MKKGLFTLSALLCTCVFIVQSASADDIRASVTVETILDNFDTKINEGLIHDIEGNLFLSNMGTNNGGNYDGDTVFRVDINGNSSVYANISSPKGLAFDLDGNLLVTSHNDRAVYRVDESGAVILVQNIPNTPGGGLEVDSAGNIYVSSWAGNVIYKIDQNNEVSTFSSGGSLSGPVGLAFDNDEQLYTSNWNNATLIRLNGMGEQEVLATVSQADNINNLAFVSGYIYMGGGVSNKVFRSDLNGVIEEVAGSGTTGDLDGFGDVAEFNTPIGISGEYNGDEIYVTEFRHSYRVRKLTVPTATSDPFNLIVLQTDEAEFFEGDNSILVDVLANDELTQDIILETRVAPSHGSIEVTEDNQISYTPDIDFNGIDSFSYRIVDEGGAASKPVQVIVKVQQAANEEPPVVKPITEEVSSGGGGVFSWLALMLAVIGFSCRQKMNIKKL